MIRIVAGAFRGRRLEVPEGIRPTTELTRKAAFDILGPSVVGAAVLDAAAGSGAYGIEALSRGAASAVFVESSSRVARTLRANLERLGGGRSLLLVETVSLYLMRGSETFDVIFHDPPYDAESDEDLAGLLTRLAPGGVLFHERGEGVGPPGVPASDERRYGATRLFIYRKESW